MNPRLGIRVVCAEPLYGPRNQRAVIVYQQQLAAEHKYAVCTIPETTLDEINEIVGVMRLLSDKLEEMVANG